MICSAGLVKPILVTSKASSAVLPSLAPPCDVLFIRLSRRSSRTQHGIYDAAPLASDALLVSRDFGKSPGEAHDAKTRWWIWGRISKLLIYEIYVIIT
jgi:hypothetical protein